jgi:hypothetical protein
MGTDEEIQEKQFIKESKAAPAAPAAPAIQAAQSAAPMSAAQEPVMTASARTITLIREESRATQSESVFETL